MVNQFPMSLYVLIFGFSRSFLGVDDTVIHKDGEPSFLDFLPEYSVHHHLKHGWRVGESEKHNRRLKQPFGGEECHFPFIARFDLYVVISPSYVKFSEQRAPCESVDYGGNERRYIMVLLCPLVHGSVVLYWS
jgi:hypothetical protein